jgi:hypothetical protein
MTFSGVWSLGKMLPAIGDCSDPHGRSGGGGIRTLAGLASRPVFKTGAIGRSATPPKHFDALIFGISGPRHIRILAEVEQDNKRWGDEDLVIGQ